MKILESDGILEICNRLIAVQYEFLIKYVCCRCFVFKFFKILYFIHGPNITVHQEMAHVICDLRQERFSS